MGPAQEESVYPVPTTNPERCSLREPVSHRSKVFSIAAGKPAARRSTGPTVTARDVDALRWVGEQYGCTYAHAAVLLGRHYGRGPVSASAVRQQVDRWQRGGLVSTQRPLNATWVTLTRRGYDLVGLTYPRWNIPVSRLAHCDAVNRVRLWYESDPARVAESGPWTSERAIFARRSLETWHVADGELSVPGSGSVTAIEVELTIKAPASRYVAEVFSRLRGDVDSVIYLCPPELRSQLKKRLAWAQQSAGVAASVHLAVRALPGASSGRRVGE